MQDDLSKAENTSFRWMAQPETELDPLDIEAARKIMDENTSGPCPCECTNIRLTK